MPRLQLQMSRMQCCHGACHGACHEHLVATEHATEHGCLQLLDMHVQRQSSLLNSTPCIAILVVVHVDCACARTVMIRS